MGNTRVITTYFVCCIAASLSLLTCGCSGGAAADPVSISGSTLQQTPAEPQINEVQSPTVAELQDLLTAELERLGKDGSKVSATVPIDERNQVFDLRGEQLSIINQFQPDVYRARVKLDWTEVLRGDYNKDGTVTSGDLAPLAGYWHHEVKYAKPGMRSGITWWPIGDPIGSSYLELLNWRLASVDGNTNGVIEIGDLTVIAQRWLDDIDGYRVERRGPIESGIEMEWEVVGHSIGQNYRYDPKYDFNPNTHSLTHSVIAGGTHEYRVVPVGNGGTGIPSLTTTVVVDASAAPVALLSCDIDYGRRPVLVNFDITGSHDPEYQPATYELWFKGDSEPAYSTTDDSVKMIPYVFDKARNYLAYLKVTDELGLVGTSDTIGIEIVDNMSPEVVCEYGPVSGVAPLTVSFDYTGTFDPDGEISSYVVYYSHDDFYGYYVHPADEPVFSDTFDEPGKYVLFLQAYDREYKSSMILAEIEVLRPGG